MAFFWFQLIFLIMLANPKINYGRAHLGLFSAIAAIIFFILSASLTFADSKRQLSEIELNPFTLKSNQNISDAFNTTDCRLRK